MNYNTIDILSGHYGFLIKILGNETENEIKPNRIVTLACPESKDLICFKIPDSAMMME